MSRYAFKNIASTSNLASHSVNPSTRVTLAGKIKEILQPCTLLLLSIIIFIAAFFLSVLASSLLGAVYALQKVPGHLKNLLQKQNCLASLLGLISLVASAYAAWVLGLVIAAAIFPAGGWVILGACVVVGWSVGLTAVAIENRQLLLSAVKSIGLWLFNYFSGFTTYFFPKKNDDVSDTLSFIPDNNRVFNPDESIPPSNNDGFYRDYGAKHFKVYGKFFTEKCSKHEDQLPLLDRTKSIEFFPIVPTNN